MKITKYISFIFLLISPFLFSCQNDLEDGKKETSSSDDIEFELDFTRAITDPDDLEDFADFFEDGKSCLLISQRGGSIGMSFEKESSNCYRYVYNRNDDANWEEGYNFTSENSLNWGKILENGQYGNGYVFGALFFPRDYDYVEVIEADQSNPDVFIESDVLGAYHHTSKVRDRLRFKLYHLMCKLQINLYVPFFDEEKGNGIDPDNVKAYCISFHTDYSIEWGSLTTEWAPLLRAGTDPTGNIQDIIMFADGNIEEIEGFDLSKYNIVDENGEPGVDHVRKYHFEALFPQQTVTGDFLRFTIIRGNTQESYLFRIDNATFNKNGFSFDSGSITRLDLYLPRTDNELVLLRGNIINWNDAEASFTITPEMDD